MRDIKDIRIDIDKVDNNLRELFIERMNLIKEVKEYKRTNNLPTLDSKREDEILSKIDKNIDFYDEVIAFSKYLLILSKTYMNK